MKITDHLFKPWPKIPSYCGVPTPLSFPGTEHLIVLCGWRAELHPEIGCAKPPMDPMAWPIENMGRRTSFPIGGVGDEAK